MKDGMKTGITERPGGVWNPASRDSDEGVWNPALLDSDDRGFPLILLTFTLYILCNFLRILPIQIFHIFFHSLHLKHWALFLLLLYF